jgi:adenine-specific DNA-methyltransferase
MISQHDKGQYFTKNLKLKQKLYSFILNKPNLILEPSVGRGDLVEYIISQNKDVQFDLYEIDKSISFLKSINVDDIHFGDFLEYNIEKTYKTIIGNPPFVKTKKGNLYIDFIDKCFKLLEENGELIFIIPTDFLKLTSSTKLINTMLENGTFTHIYHPNNENLFENATIDIIIFRYCKNKKLPNKILFNDNEKYLINTNGIITFTDKVNENLVKFSEIFDIYVGIVSGKEKIFKNNKYGNVQVLNAKNKKEKYILINEFPTNNENLNKYLLENKETLINRKIRKFNNDNWFEWGALRNIKKMIENIGKDCIYVSNLTRKDEICFKSSVNLFGGGLIIMIPKKNINLSKVVKFINSNIFKDNYMYSGRFKIGHKQLCNSLFDYKSFTK